MKNQKKKFVEPAVLKYKDSLDKITLHGGRCYKGEDDHDGLIWKHKVKKDWD